jgi:hypothetical protein
MRISIVAVALAFGFAASPAQSQALILEMRPAVTETVPTVADTAPAVTETAPPEPLRAPATADSAPALPPPAAPSRYSFDRVDGGFLRLDGASGQIAFCGPRTVGWTCQAVPEDRAALEREIARLQDEVAALKADLAALREPPRPPGELAPPPKTGEPKIKLPSSGDIERARAVIEDAWRRLVDMIDALHKDIMRKG